eukprot:SAG11_NODE_478_length_9117_cov_6.916168_6_plen_100_part_00
MNCNDELTFEPCSTVVRPDWAPYAAGATFGVDLEIEMAQNERESGQVVIVASLQRPAVNVSWGLQSDSDWSDGGVLDVSISPFGFVHQVCTSSPPPNTA